MNKPEKNDPSWHLLHNGILAKQMMAHMPDIFTFTLCKEGDSNHRVTVKSIPKAIQALIEKYPILRGRVLRTKGPKGKIEYWVKEGVFSSHANDYLDIVDLSTGDDQVPTPAGLNHSETLNYLDKHIISRFGNVLTVGKREKQQLKLFEVKVILLPHFHYCLALNLCHCLGDATTYYQLLDELVRLVDGKVPISRTLSWGNDVFTSKDYMTTARDNNILSGFPFLIGMARTYLRYGGNKKKNKRFNFTVVDKKLVDKVKQDLKAPDVEFLSTNDIITSFICKAKPKYEIVIVTRNDRKRVDGISSHDAGIFLSYLVLPANLSRDPNFVRKVVEKGEHYPPNKLARRPFYRGRFIITTNWATAQERDSHVAAVGDSVVAHVPDPAFVRDLPFGTVLISSFNETSLLVMHNFPEKSLSAQGKGLLRSISV